MSARVMLVLAGLLAACTSRPEPITNTWGGIEGRSFPDGPHLSGGTDVLVVLDDLDARLGIVAWPELIPVPCEVLEQEHPLGERFGPVVWLTPDEPLQDRWYAIRWSGETDPYTRLVGAIPLADGSRVWRFHGRYVPELAALNYGEGVLGFSTFDEFGPEGKVVPACDAPEPAVIVEQDERSWTVSCGAADATPILETPGFDPSRPFRLQVLPDALVTNDGLAYHPIDLVLESATSLLVPLPPGRSPPLVPAALCAGVACE